MTRQFKHRPIPRHESLAPLSRDHYIGLVQARRLCQAAAADPASRRKTLAAFADAWRHEIAVHFEDEERLLLPRAEPADGERLRAEHAALRDLAGQALAERREVDPDPQVLERLGSQLNAHIRWEERELFNRVQESLGVEERSALQDRTALLEASRRRSRTG